MLGLVYKAKSPGLLSLRDILLSYVLSSTKHSFFIFRILCSRMDGSSNVAVTHEQCKFNIPQRL